MKRIFRRVPVVTCAVLAVIASVLAACAGGAGNAPAISADSENANVSLRSRSGTIPVALEEKGILPHLRDAGLIAHDIDSAHNAYAHKDCFIKWKGENGATIYENSTDCSDFLNLLLEHTYQISTADLHTLTGHERPTATIWYDTIVAGKGFDVIPTIKEVKPGDIIAVQYPPGEEDTGHIMLIAGDPEPRAATAPLVDKTQQWEIAVIDSSKSGHGPKDTRHHPDGIFDRGVGQGTLRLYSNADGSLAGYAWSVLSASVFESSAVHKITVGRLQLKTIHPTQ